MKTLVGLMLTSLLGMGVVSLKQNTTSKKIDEAPLIETLAPVKETLDYDSNPTNENRWSSQFISMNHIGNIQSVWNDYRGDGVTIAVIDTGTRKGHEDFWNGSYCNISDDSASFTTDNAIRTVKDDGWDVIEAGEELHGLATSATAAASISGYGTVGVAPNATIMVLKTDLYSNSSMNAVRYAVDHGASVINMSFGSYGDDSSISLYQGAIDYAYSKGAIIVASAGNEDTNSRHFPSSCNHVVGVGALARNSGTERAYYSNYNQPGTTWQNVDCTAPGTVFTATNYSNGTSYYNEMNGTSFSGPIVAGAAALYKQKYPEADQDRFEEALQATCDKIGNFDTFGWGALNVEKLMNYGENYDVEYQTTNLTTKNQDATIIKWNDNSSWQFRTLHLWNVGFFEGYTHKDFTNYLTIECGAKVSRASWNFEGTTAGWAFNQEGVRGDFLISVGGSGPSYQIALPWWVTNGLFQFVNNSNWLPGGENSKPWIYSGDDHYKSLMEFDINSGNLNWKTPVTGANYDFKAVKVSRTLLNANGTTKQELGVYKTCLYDILKNSSLTTDDAKFDGCSTTAWYTNQNCSSVFVNQVVRFDMHVYAKVFENNNPFYFQSQDWGEHMYAYEYFVDSNGIVNEPLGPWPGTEMSAFNGVTFNGSGIWAIDTYLPSGTTAYVVLTNNNEAQTPDFPLIQKGYYYYYISETEDYYTSRGDWYSAIEFVRDFRNAMLDVSASGSVKEGSICGLTTAQRNAFLTRYNALDTANKNLVDSTTIWTYKSNTDEYENVTMLAMLNEISTSNSSAAKLMINDLNSPLIVLMSIMALSVSVLMLVALKKKKHN